MSLRDIVAAIRRRRQKPPLPAPAEAQADCVEVFKSERRMDLKRDGTTIRSYRVALGFAPERHKEREGDGRTPEGSYTVDARNPRSAFHLSLRVSYPDEHDKTHAAVLGVPPGGDIYIHGQPNGWRGFLIWDEGIVWN